jgi:hypothetical protein
MVRGAVADALGGATMRMISLPIAVALLLDACPSEQPLKAPERKSTYSDLYPDRYEIHDVRNGGLVTSVLLDKRTGRAWIMAQGEFGGRKYQSFEEIGESPKPCLEVLPMGNGACMADAPLPPK